MASQRTGERMLSLDFECLRSIPEGINEVRVWHDNLLDCDRVGKRIDTSGASTGDVLPEPATLQSIQHRNVVPILAAALVDGYQPPLRVVEIVTPYYPRGSITDALLRGERFVASEAVAIVQAALRGLGELHEVHGICHRDIKSGNILLPDDLTVAKVADLGLAGAFSAGGTVPALNNPTLYSPPEIASTGVLSRPSDIYPVGLILRELLGGAFPYVDYTTASIVQRLAHGRCPLTRLDLELPVWTSRSLRRIVGKALKKNPAERYQSAAEMDGALARATVLDWTQVHEMRWEAPFLYQNRRVAVTADYRPSRGDYKVSTLTRKTSWRRATGDVYLADLVGVDARKVFDHASDIATAS